MNSKPIIVLLFLLASFLFLFGQNTNFGHSQPNSRQRLQAMRFTTPAYQKEALRLIIEEANKAARDLSLPEQLPITESNILSAYISPPGMTAIGFGNITTSNYTYYMTVGNKFSFLTKRNLEKDYSQLRKDYLWLITQMDTNAAYQMATQFLHAASMDTKALEQDCTLAVQAFIPEGEHGAHFVPLYWVSWSKKDQPVASVEFLLPTKTLRQLHVNKSEYILRNPLVVTNLTELLSQTNSP